LIVTTEPEHSKHLIKYIKRNTYRSGLN